MSKSASPVKDGLVAEKSWPLIGHATSPFRIHIMEPLAQARAVAPVTVTSRAAPMANGTAFMMGGRARRGRRGSVDQVMRYL
jgi:hypothetical protein